MPVSLQGMSRDPGRGGFFLSWILVSSSSLSWSEHGKDFMLSSTSWRGSQASRLCIVKDLPSSRVRSCYAYGVIPGSDFLQKQFVFVGFLFPSLSHSCDSGVCLRTHSRLPACSPSCVLLLGVVFALLFSSWLDLTAKPQGWPLHDATLVNQSFLGPVEARGGHVSMCWAIGPRLQSSRQLPLEARGIQLCCLFQGEARPQQAWVGGLGMRLGLLSLARLCPPSWAIQRALPCGHSAVFFCF